MMLHPKFIVDEKGRRKGVILSIKEFNETVELIEDALDVKLIEEVKNQPTVPVGRSKEKAKEKIKKEWMGMQLLQR